MAISNRERIGGALEVLRDGLAPYVLGQALDKLPEQARYAVKRRLLGEGPIPEDATPHQLTARMDIHEVLLVMWDFWRECFHDQLGHAGRTLVSELRNVRNDWAHQQPFDLDDTYRALDTMLRLLEMISAREQAERIRVERDRVGREKFERDTQQAVRRGSEAAVTATVEGLRPWRMVAEPHPDVREGRYAQAEFAADLWQVHEGVAGDEYGDPVEFFRRTYATDGIRRLARLAIERLAGGGGEPVVELQTSFGGGKTHSLLVLYHLVSGRVKPADAETLETLAREAEVTAFPTATRAVLVGTKLSPAAPWRAPDGTEIRTLWGELAWQLGGREGYALVAEADRKAVSPGAALVDLLRRFGPALVLIDEWVAFARQLVDRTDLPAGTFETHMSFAQSLSEAAAAVSNAVVVVSLPESDIEIGGPAGQRALEGIRNVMRRVEGVWRPATAEESFEIVRRRLFLAIEDNAARNATCRRFAQLYQRSRGDFPSETAEAAYEDRLRRAYPIHPELFDRLYQDWSTIDRFQRTRGVLRLMAKIIHALWERDDAAPLILPGTVPLDAPEVQSELVQYLPEGWNAVLDTDVDGPHSRPFHIDRQITRFGRHAAARRVARTVFLGSAPSVAGQQARGLERVRALLGSAMPGEQLSVFGDALSRLAEEATYLYGDGARYWYDTRPNINRTARDRAAQIPGPEIEARIAAELRRTGPRGVFAGVHSAPASSGEVPDEPDLRLVVLGPDAPWSEGGGAAEDAAAEILEHRGSAPRIWRNVLLFLAPEHSGVDGVRDAARLLMAWESIVGDIEAERLNVDLAQRRQALAARDQARATLEARLNETWCRLLVPSQEEGTGPVQWQVEKVPGGDGSFAERTGRRAVENGHVYTSLGPEVLQLYLDRFGLWGDDDHILLKRFWEWCCRYVYMPRLASRDVLLACVQDAAKKIVSSPFAYAERFDEASGRYLGLALDGQVPSVRLDEHAVIVRIEAARRQREEEGREAPAPGPEPSGPAPAPGPGAPVQPGPGPAPEPQPALPRRFHGAVQMDTLRLGTRAGQIAEEVLAHLAKLPGAQVEVALEIQVRVPQGIPEGVRRVVAENCRTLGFEQFGFEEE